MSGAKRGNQWKETKYKHKKSENMERIDTFFVKMIDKFKNRIFMNAFVTYAIHVCYDADAMIIIITIIFISINLLIQFHLK